MARGADCSEGVRYIEPFGSRNCEAEGRESRSRKRKEKTGSKRPPTIGKPSAAAHKKLTDRGRILGFHRRRRLRV